MGLPDLVVREREHLRVAKAGAVDAVLVEAAAAGATIGRPGAPTFWGGYSGVFVDPDGFLTEGSFTSLFVERDSVPDVLEVTATTEDGVAMAIEHKTLPVGGVQFHPESLMSLSGEVGLRIVENAFRLNVPFN